MRKMFFILLFIPLFSLAESDTGNDMYNVFSSHDACKRNNNCSSGVIGNSVFYDGYIIGVTEALNTFAFCTRNGVTRKQVIDVVNKYTMAHPEERDQRALVLVVNSLKESFPCDRK